MSRKFGAPAFSSSTPSSVSLDLLAQSNLTGPVGLNVDFGAVTAAIGVAAQAYLFNPAGAGGLISERLRTPTVWSGANASAIGATAIWTPAAGKKFRLMAGFIMVPSNCIQAVAGLIAFGLQDAAGAFMGKSFTTFVPGAAGPTGPPLGFWPFVIPGNGWLSALANNSLNVNLSAALTTGLCIVGTMGTEE
jgi:hypothetical protein